MTLLWPRCLAKFGTQSLASVMIGATPVVLKGWRHSASWLLAFALVQLFPGDAVFRNMQKHSSLKIAVKFAGALYKLRKFNFVAEFYGTHVHQNFPWM